MVVGFQGSRLFAKILLSFLATAALVNAVFFLIDLNIHERNETENLKTMRENFAHHGQLLPTFLEDQTPLRDKILANLPGPSIEVYSESGQRIPLPSSSSGSGKLQEELPDLASYVPLVLKSSDGGAVFTVGDKDYIGQQFSSTSGKTYVCFYSPRRSRGSRFLPSAILDKPMFLGIVVIFLIIGLLCFWLAQNLLKPVIILQNLSRRISGGDFQARVPEELTGRFDELGALAKDFNIMAGKIEKTLKDQQQLFWDISHELRTPLTRMELALELIRTADPEKREQLVQKMRANINRLNTLIQQILDFSRLSNLENGPVGTGSTSELLPSGFERIGLVSLGRQIISDAQLEAEARKMNLHGNFPDTEIFVNGSEELLRRALENLVQNAFRHTPSGTTIGMSIFAPDRETVAVQVKDSGKGVPSEDLPHLFEPFFRCGTAAPQENRGVGLGLAIVERVVKGHKGTVLARNPSEGGFLVELQFPQVPTQQEGSFGTAGHRKGEKTPLNLKFNSP